MVLVLVLILVFAFVELVGPGLAGLAGLAGLGLDIKAWGKKRIFSVTFTVTVAVSFPLFVPFSVFCSMSVLGPKSAFLWDLDLLSGKRKG